MVILNIEKHRKYSHQELINLGLSESKLPYNNFKVYKKKSIFYLFKFTESDKLLLDSINY